MGPTWGLPGSFRPQMGPMLAPWTLLAGMLPRICAVIRPYCATVNQMVDELDCLCGRLLLYEHCDDLLMMASSNGNIFCVTGHLCGEFTDHRRPVTWSFDVFFDLRLNIRLSKQSWGRSFETPPCPLWRHCSGVSSAAHIYLCCQERG